MERELSKDEILTRYLNTVYFGQGAYGIQAAARTYFSVPASALDLQQASLLVGLVQAPSAYDPVEHPALALQRRNVVLGILRRQEVIDDGQYQATLATGLDLRPGGQERYRAPYFVQYVKQWLVLEPRLRGDPGGSGEPAVPRRHPRLHDAPARSPARRGEGRQRDPDLPDRPLRRHDRGRPAGRPPPRHGRRPRLLLDDGPGRADQSGHGGITGRQAGSTFKPFALVAAMLNGIPPQQVYDAPPSIDIPLPQECQAPGEPVWPVSNFNGTGSGQMTVEQATIDSVNVVYAQIVRDLGGGDPCAGAAKVVEVAKALGVNPPELMEIGVSHPLARVPSAVLGAEQVNSLEMASAYGTLANVGYRVAPVAVTRITDAEGKVLWRAREHRTLAVDPPVAYVADQILQKVVQEEPAPRPPSTAPRSARRARHRNTATPGSSARSRSSRRPSGWDSRRARCPWWRPAPGSPRCSGERGRRRSGACS